MRQDLCAWPRGGGHPIGTSGAGWALACVGILFLAGCVSDATTLSPASPKAPPTQIYVLRQGRWFSATITMILADERVMVHYDNTSDVLNEPVPLDRVKSPTALAAFLTAPDYQVGDKVLVGLQGRLFLGDITDVQASKLFRVHLDGYGPEVADNLAAVRLQHIYSGTTPHPKGEAVVVSVNGKPASGKVLAPVAADRWLVRFDGLGPQHDLAVGPDRIQSATATASAPAPPPPVLAPSPAEVASPQVGSKALRAERFVEVPSGPPAVDEVIFTNLHGAWISGTVTSVEPTDVVRVKFKGGTEEEIDLPRVKRQPTSMDGRSFSPGQMVLVEWRGYFASATVLRPEGKGSYRVRFDGQGPEADEVVSVKRLRVR